MNTSDLINTVKNAVEAGKRLLVGTPEREQIRRQIEKLTAVKVDADRGLRDLQKRFNVVEGTIRDHVAQFQEAKENGQIGRAKTLKALAEEATREHKSLESEIDFHMAQLRLLNESIAALRAREPRQTAELDVDELIVGKQEALDRSSDALAKARELSSLQPSSIPVDQDSSPSRITQPVESLELSPEVAAFALPRKKEAKRESSIQE